MASLVIDIDRRAVDPAFSQRRCGRRLVRAVPLANSTVVNTAREQTSENLIREHPTALCAS